MRAATWCAAWLVGSAFAAHGAEPARASVPRARVVAVYPSGDVVPERLLRITVRFDRSPAPAVRDSVALLAASDDPLARVRLAGALLPDGLWSPDGTLLTLLFRPGRVKTGLRSHQRDGWALTPGQPVALAVGGEVVKRWRVVSGGCAPLAPETWRVVRPPRSGTRHLVVVRLAAPVDVHAGALIAVADAAGARVPGRAGLGDGERAWTLVPDRPWRPGTYSVRVHPRVETPCGDEAGDAFEHAAGALVGTPRAVTPRFVVAEPRE